MGDLQDHGTSQEANGTSMRRGSGRASGARDGKGNGKGTPVRRRSNRAAQARYREKRKAQAAELETQVAVLTMELASMEAVKAENARLRDALAWSRERDAAAAAAAAAADDMADEAVAGASTCTGSMSTGVADLGQAFLDGGAGVISAGGSADEETQHAHNRDTSAYDEVVAHQLVIRGRLQHLLEAAGVPVAEATCASNLASTFLQS
jgi:hypothetical protein